MVAVKGNAYGHGTVRVSQAAVAHGADALGAAVRSPDSSDPIALLWLKNRSSPVVPSNRPRKIGMLVWSCLLLVFPDALNIDAIFVAPFLEIFTGEICDEV